MRKKGDQQNIPKEFFPGDSEDFKIEGPSDTFSSNNKSNQVNNSISNNKFSVYNNSIIRSNNNKFNLQDSEESNNNKFKNDYKPKSKRIDNDEDDELEAMLNQTKMKQKENKLKEKSIIINPSEFQLQNSNNKNQNSQNEIKNMKDKNEESINNIYNNSNNNYSSNINKSNKKKAQRYDDLNSIGNSYQSSSINDNVNIKGDNSSNTFMNSQLKLSSTQKSNLTNNIRNTHINNINNESSNEISMNVPKYKMPKRNPELTKEEIILNEKINFNNYTDDIIEEFFTKNNFDDSPNFFYDLASEMQNGQRHINHKLKKIIKDDEINNAKLAQKKQEYITKLEKIKKNNSAFEQKVNDLNELYCDKLSYISLISKIYMNMKNFIKILILL